jgi:hypothetical protein
MTEEEFQGIIATLEQENRLMRARNERLQEELDDLKNTIAGLMAKVLEK